MVQLAPWPFGTVDCAVARPSRNILSLTPPPQATVPKVVCGAAAPTNGPASELQRAAHVHVVAGSSRNGTPNKKRCRCQRDERGQALHRLNFWLPGEGQTIRIVTPWACRVRPSEEIPSI